MSNKRSIAETVWENEISPQKISHEIKLMEGVSFAGMHGTSMIIETRSQTKSKLKPPRLLRECDRPARPGYERSMLCHEYSDGDATLFYKVNALAEMIRNARNCVVYAGAGLSTSAGIGDYASRGNESSVTHTMASKKSCREVSPATGHRALVAMHRAGFIKELIQQNHDGLPQKAGFPQHCVNEIHGAWFDPSNPVVSMSGSLRGDLVNRFDKTANEADLVLALGSSLAATNADRIVQIAVERKDAAKSQGVVIVSLQRTSFDEMSSLRIFAKLDDVLSMVAAELGVSIPQHMDYVPDVPSSFVVAEDVFSIPYDSEGELLPTDSQAGDHHRSEWDLRTGSKVIIKYGPGAGLSGEVKGKSSDGHYLVEFPRITGYNDEWLIERDRKRHPEVDPRAPRVYTLGSWWVESATKGLCDRIPFVSIN